MIRLVIRFCHRNVKNRITDVVILRVLAAKASLTSRRSLVQVQYRPLISPCKTVTYRGFFRDAFFSVIRFCDEHAGIPGAPDSVSAFPESMGFPIPIRNDGTLSLPCIQPVYPRQVTERNSRACQKCLSEGHSKPKYCHSNSLVPGTPILEKRNMGPNPFLRRSVQQVETGAWNIK